MSEQTAMEASVARTRRTVRSRLQRVEQKKQSPAKSWSQFLKDVKALS